MLEVGGLGHLMGVGLGVSVSRSFEYGTEMVKKWNGGGVGGRERRTLSFGIWGGSAAIVAISVCGM